MDVQWALYFSRELPVESAVVIVNIHFMGVFQILRRMPLASKNSTLLLMSFMTAVCALRHPMRSRLLKGKKYKRERHDAHSHNE